MLFKKIHKKDRDKMEEGFLKKHKWGIFLGVSLVMLSVVFYSIHYLIFHDPHHVFIYLVGDIAFVPIEVLLVTLILHKVLEFREKKAMLTKMNMVIGSFFSEVGEELIKQLINFSKKHNTELFLFDTGWERKDFTKKSKEALSVNYACDILASDVSALNDFLNSKKTFVLSLLCNPNLMEHEGFTDLLWAVSHLGEEFALRKDLSSFVPEDKKHLEGDMQRAFSRVLSQWLLYNRHLMEHYPYLYSLSVRVNPFCDGPGAEISA